MYMLAGKIATAFNLTKINTKKKIQRKSFFFLLHIFQKHGNNDFQSKENEWSIYSQTRFQIIL